MSPWTAAPNETLRANHSANHTPAHCTQLQSYLPFEPLYYLYFMCPVAITGILLNVVSLQVFKAKSFNATVTFKYLRIITRADLCICTIVLFYCLSMYTPAFNYYDLYVRHFYLAYIYIPFANLLINLRCPSSSSFARAR